MVNTSQHTHAPFVLVTKGYDIMDVEIHTYVYVMCSLYTQGCRVYEHLGLDVRGNAI